MKLIVLLAIVSAVPAYAQTKKPPVAAGGWVSKVTHNRIDDTTTTSFLLASIDRSAYLHFDCTNNVVFADNRRGIERKFYIMTGRFLDPDERAQVRIDGGSPISLTTVRSSDYKGAFIEDHGFMKEFYRHTGISFPEDQVAYTEFIPAVMQANEVLVQLPIFHSTDHLWEFRPKGVNMDEVERACKISDPLPRDPSSHAIDRSH